MDIFLDILLKPPQPFIGLFLHAINIYLRVEKTNFLGHNHILLIHFDVMDNFCDEQ